MSTANKQRRGSSSPTAPPEEAAPENTFEGDYRPRSEEPPQVANIRVDPVHQVEFLHSLADALNTTLDLNTLMHRVADLVRAVIDYRIFAILLLNDRTQELWMRFQIGHTPDIERTRIKIGSGIIGQPIAYKGPDGKEYIAILSGVGGWSGAIVPGNLDPRDPSGALGMVGVMPDLKSKTTAGGMLYVFALPS